MDKSVSVRTNEGVKIIIDLSVDYQLGTQKGSVQLISQLLYIYNSVGSNWSSLIIQICKGVIADVLSQYSVFDIYSKRVEIQNLFFDELNYELAAQNFLLNSALILNFAFPPEFTNSKEMLEIINQNILQAQYRIFNIRANYTSNQIIANTNISNVNIDSQVINYVANNKAQEILKLKYSLGTTLSSRYSAMFQSLNNFKTSLNIKDKTNKTAASQLLTYFWLKVN